MNPLPNRPLLNTSSMPLSLPNVPSFEQIAYHRPRKVLPEAGKDFPVLNGHSSIPGPSSGSTATGPLLDRGNAIGASQAQQSAAIIAQPSTSQAQPSPMSSQGEKEGDSDSRQLTAIFRPGDSGDWKEKLRLSYEASEQAKLAREGQTGSGGGANSWDRHREDEDESKEEEGEADDDDATVISEGDETKVWKVKRTFRKLVA